MPETSTTDRDGLQDALSSLIDAEGRWLRDAVEDLDAGLWAGWFSARLRGRDPFFSYSREEQTHGRVNLYLDLLRRLPDLDRENMVEGLALLFGGVEPDHEDGIVLSEMLYLARVIRARDFDAGHIIRSILRRWIADESLLRRPEPDAQQVPGPHDLHRKAMNALLMFQRRGDEADCQVWEEWLDDDSLNGIAFAGLALSLASFPEGMLRDFLDRIEDPERLGIMQHALEALFVDQPHPKRTQAYVWAEVHRGGDPEDWRRLRGLLGRVVDLPSYEVMQRRNPPETLTEGRDQQVARETDLVASIEASQLWDEYRAPKRAA